MCYYIQVSVTIMYKGRLDGAVCEYTEADKMAYLQEVSQKVALLPGVESELSGTSCCLRECRTWRWRRWCSPPWPTWQASGPLLSASLFLTGWKATRWTLQCIVWFVFCWFFDSCSFKFIYDSWLCTKACPNQPGDNTKGGANSLAVSTHGDCGKVAFQ